MIVLPPQCKTSHEAKLLVHSGQRQRDLLPARVSPHLRPIASPASQGRMCVAISQKHLERGIGVLDNNIGIARLLCADKD